MAWTLQNVSKNILCNLLYRFLIFFRFWWEQFGLWHNEQVANRNNFKHCCNRYASICFNLLCYWTINGIWCRISFDFHTSVIAKKNTLRFSNFDKFNPKILSVLCIYVQIEIKRNFVTLSNSLKCLAKFYHAFQVELWWIFLCIIYRLNLLDSTETNNSSIYRSYLTLQRIGSRYFINTDSLSTL